MDTRHPLDNKSWQNLLIGATGFGLGSLAGSLALWLMLKSSLIGLLVGFVDEQQVLVRLLAGILLAMLALLVAGGIQGALSGLTLSYLDPLAVKRRYILSGSIAFAVPHALLTLLVILLIGLIGFYNNNADMQGNGGGIASFFGVIGLVYGLVIGLLIGILSVGLRQSWRVVLASLAGFGSGGALIGFLLAMALRSSQQGERLSGLLVLLGLGFLFNFFGGAPLGMLYGWFARKRSQEGGIPKEVSRFWRIVGAALGILVLVIAGLVVNKLFQFVTIQEGSLASVIPTETVGVGWTERQDINPTGGESTLASIAIDPAGAPAIAWSGGSGSAQDVFLATALLDQENPVILWSEPVNVSNSASTASTQPQVVADASGAWHLVWSEAEDAQSSRTDILYSRCQAGSCTTPARLSDLSGLACAAPDAGEGKNLWPSISMDNHGTVMVAWQAGQNTLPYSTWSAGESPPATPTGCIPTGGLEHAAAPRLAALAPGSFSVGFAGGASTDQSEMFVSGFQNQAWDSSPAAFGSGGPPAIYGDDQSQLHLAWCASEPTGSKQVLYYQPPQGAPQQIDSPPCLGRPEMIQDGYGKLHLLWYSDEVRDAMGAISPGYFLYETIQTAEGWSPAAIVTPLAAAAQPSVAGDQSGDLHLAWAEPSPSGGSVYYSRQPYYDCSSAEISPLGQAILEIFESGEYRPADEIIPFCQNRYERLVYMPNPRPVFSSEQASLNGGYDTIAGLIASAKYEVLITTMEWQEDTDSMSPGLTLVEAVAELYDKVKANPSDYPRGMTVRIMLGNYPVLSSFEYGSQIWNVIDDIQKAGIETMVDPEIGWRLEIANFDGQYPHSHTKFLVVDGKTTVAAGYNTSYLHLPREHPSQKGIELVDLGMQISGPVAQASLAVFDDQWEGSDILDCRNLDPPLGIWFFSCQYRVAVADHPSEVLRYYLPDSNSVAFSLYRNTNYHESDEAVTTALSSATQSLDVFEVNFSLEVQCMLMLVSQDLCSFENALPYMDAMLAAIEQNHVKTRVLVTNVNSNGLENFIAIHVFREELERRGLEEYVEFRFYEGRMHTKAALIDDAFLIIGSQNFHYSAFGDGGLAEYNLATEDPQAIQAFQDAFEYYWDLGIPLDQAKPAFE